MNEDEEYMKEVICFGGSLDGMWKRVDVRHWCFKWAVYHKLNLQEITDLTNFTLEEERYEILRARTPRGTEYYIGELVSEQL
jgi:hypothetical protein